MVSKVMKSKIYLTVFLLIGSLVISCSSDDDFNYQYDFEKSYRDWLHFKDLSADSYQYTVLGSSWIGFSWETKITISNGEVVERHFKYVAPDDLGEIPEEEIEWIESGQEVGSHQNQAAEPLTMDEIYAKAKNDWLIKRKNAKTYFETGNNGLISTCGYVINGCMDDCFIGIHIKNIKSL